LIADKLLIGFMKYFLKQILLVLFILTCGTALANPLQRTPKRDTISILDAKLHKKLVVSIRGSYNPNKLQPDLVSAHFGECIDIRLRNMSDSVINVVLKCGTMLLSRDSSFQNMVVTKTLFYSLRPREEHYDRVYAMCGQLHKNSPDISIRYDVGEQADEPLLKLAKMIEKTNSQTKAGQYAVWAVTDGATKDDLGEDFDALQQSQALLNKADIQVNILGKHSQAAIPMKESNSKVELKKATPNNLSTSSNNKNAGKEIKSIEVNTPNDSNALSLVENIITNPISQQGIQEAEKEDEFPNDVQISNNEVIVDNKNENYWLLMASFSVILFGLYYFWKKKPHITKSNNSKDLV
jgi:hypothetical protein